MSTWPLDQYIDGKLFVSAFHPYLDQAKGSNICGATGFAIAAMWVWIFDTPPANSVMFLVYGVRRTAGKSPDRSIRTRSCTARYVSVNKKNKLLTWDEWMFTAPNVVHCLFCLYEQTKKLIAYKDFLSFYGWYSIYCLFGVEKNIFFYFHWHVIKKYGRELSTVQRWASNSQYWWSYGTLNF